MADTGGIAALLKALNESPALGAGLKPGASVAKVSSPGQASAFAAAAGINKPSAATATIAATSARPIRAASSLGATAAKPKIHVADDGMSYRANAPRGTYLDMVV
jgi:hypothetical protein